MKRHHREILALGRLGWPLRRIEQATSGRGGGGSSWHSAILLSRVSFAKTPSGGQVVDLSALIRRRSQLDDQPPAPPPSALPVPLRRPPPARPGEPRRPPRGYGVCRNPFHDPAAGAEPFD